MQLNKISFNLDNFSLDLFGTEAVQHIVPRGKTNPYANNVCSTEFTVLMENYYIHTRIKKQELLFYSEPRFNVAAVIGIAKLGVPQSRHVLAS